MDLEFIMTSSGFAVSKRPATVQAFPRTTTLYSITSSYYRGQFIALSRRPHSQLKARVFAECRIITAPSSRRLLLHASMDSTDLQPSFMQEHSGAVTPAISSLESW